MKRTIAALLAVSLLLLLTGCGEAPTQAPAATQQVISPAQTPAASIPAVSAPAETKKAAAPEQTPAPGKESGLGLTENAPAAESKIEARTYKSLNPEKALSDEQKTTFVGYGYDILNNSYIHLEGFQKQNPILDTDEVQKRLIQSDAPAQHSYTISGQSMKEYSNDFSSQMELSSDYPLFTGKVSSEFDKDQSTKTNVYYIKSFSTYPTYSEYIKNSNDLNKILDSVFAQDLNGNMSPKDLFGKYGTHVVLEDLMGGHCEFNYTYTSTETETKTQLKAKVEATYRYISGSASASDTQTATSFLSSSSFTSALSGGKKIDATTLQKLIANMSGWIKSIDKSTSTICSVSNMNSLKPIWELASDPTRQKEISDYYEKMGGDKEDYILNWPDTYIESVVILSDKSKNKAKAAVPAGYTLIDNDLNKGSGGNFIYLAYATTDSAEDALKDIRVSFGKSYKMPDAYTKDQHDLNAGAGGKFIYLWTTKDGSCGNPLQDMQVIYGKNADMPSGYTAVDSNRSGSPADLNSGAGGEFVYLGIKHRK